MMSAETPRRPRGRPRTRPERTSPPREGKGRPPVAPAPGETAADFLRAAPSILRVSRIIDAGLDIDGRTTDGTGRTALHVARDCSLREGCRMLIEAGADPRARDAAGRMAFEPSDVSPDEDETERGTLRVAMLRDIGELPLIALRVARAAWIRAIESMTHSEKRNGDEK